MRVLKPMYRKDLVSDKMHVVCIAHSGIDGFVSSSLRFLSGFAEAPWIDGGTRLGGVWWGVRAAEGTTAWNSASGPRRSVLTKALSVFSLDKSSLKTGGLVYRPGGRV